MLPTFAYIRAQSLDEAVRQLAADGARIHAGGTDLLGCLRDRVFHADKLVSITALPGLRGIATGRDGALRIGALTTVAEVAGNPTVRERYPGLAQAASEVASPQLRNQGTIGGNLCQRPRCWYFRGEFHCLRKGGTTCYALAGENQYHCILGGSRCYIVHPSDTAPTLLALGASVEVAGPKGRRTVSLDEFYVLPSADIQRETVLAQGEVVTHAVVPRPGTGIRSSYRKVRARGSWDFALAGVALALRFDAGRVVDGRVVLSGAAPVPWRSREAESVIVGSRLEPDVCRRAAVAAMASAVPLKRNGYKVPLFTGVIEEELGKLGRA
ncbi:MAG: xanthine dehydrogenase family protein subunit M [Gemmatimonadota bacterium]|nr:xanthine dehydrogenase family protein subunit M [Gemmatimonadota bacterium]MDH3366721.1 xanthine dehydrogenase family protein subunit M [Gemmatimonadota bacterium]MDH3478442.1 xanthine dehydrogenase family protein subunit M [Gemmatimonadota bacterium]MDH3569230.1 xanthine dehydrogenase family protein subunit M [Gemmatimonadota bacterium]